MKFAVIQFPGSNCDQDCIAAINSIEGLRAEYVWHKETSLRDFDAIVLPGGFAYGDYLRCGAIARFSPIMKAVMNDARAGKLVLGTCNGFQVLCEAGLLPGALVRNRSLRFVCEMVTTRVEVPDSPFTHGLPEGTLLRLPIAHGEGCFYADPETLRKLNEDRQVILRYAGQPGPHRSGSESERFDRKHRRDLQSRTQRFWTDAASRSRQRRKAWQRRWREDFSLDDANHRSQSRGRGVRINRRKRR